MYMHSPTLLKVLPLSNFNNPDHKKHLLTIFDLSGKTSRQIDNITTEEVIIKRDDLPRGVYFYQLENDIGIIGNGKLLIE